MDPTDGVDLDFNSLLDWADLHPEPGPKRSKPEGPSYSDAVNNADTRPTPPHAPHHPHDLVASPNDSLEGLPAVLGDDPEAGDDLPDLYMDTMDLFDMDVDVDGLPLGMHEVEGILANQPRSPAHAATAGPAAAPGNARGRPSRRREGPPPAAAAARLPPPLPLQRPRSSSTAKARPPAALVPGAPSGEPMDVCAPPLPVPLCPLEVKNSARLAEKRKRRELDEEARYCSRPIPVPMDGGLLMLAPPAPGMPSPGAELGVSRTGLAPMPPIVVAFPNFGLRMSGAAAGGGAGAPGRPPPLAGSVTSGPAPLLAPSATNPDAAAAAAGPAAPGLVPPPPPPVAFFPPVPAAAAPPPPATPPPDPHALCNETWYAPAAEPAETVAYRGDLWVNPFRLREDFPVTTTAGQRHDTFAVSPVNEVVARTGDRLKDQRLKTAVRVLAREELLQCCERMGLRWGRVKGYPYWPCQVMRLSDARLAQYKLTDARHKQDAQAVMYFGTDMFAMPEVSWLGGADLVPWREGMRDSMGAKAAGNKRLLSSMFQLLDYLGVAIRGVQTSPGATPAEPEGEPAAVTLGAAAPSAEEGKPAATEAAVEEPKPAPPLPATAPLTGKASKVPTEFEAVLQYPRVPPQWWEVRTPLLPWAPAAPPPAPTPPPAAPKDKKKGKKKGKGAEDDAGDREDSGDKAGTSASARALRAAQWPAAGPMLPAHPEGFALPDAVRLLPRHPPKYESLRRNVYVGVPPPRRRHKDDVDTCMCAPDSDCGEDCYNRISNTLCDPKACPCGDKCSNGPFQRRVLPKMEVYLTENRGWGARALQPIAQGAFVCEYLGEVVNGKEAASRMRHAKMVGEPNFYIMDLGADRLIDAYRRGGIARFLNSSCDPNCATQKWTEAASDECRVGLFALRDIAPGEELTYNYNFEHAGTESMAQSFRCLCGAANCRGTMDKRPERHRLNNLGRRVEVLWDDNAFYRGTVIGFNKAKGLFDILYDDDDVEAVDLSAVGYKFLRHDAPLRPQPPSREEQPEAYAAYLEEVAALVVEDQTLQGGRRAAAVPEDERLYDNLEQTLAAKPLLEAQPGVGMAQGAQPEDVDLLNHDLLLIE